MKFLLQNDYAVNSQTFKSFVLFLERCKGFEEDAKRFVSLTSETKHVQVDYDLLRPLFLRTIKNKTGNEVLKLFEQFRKNLKLNKANQELNSEERAAKLKTIKCDIYDGLIKDLLQVKAYALSQVIFVEKMREKYEVTVTDHLTGLEIFAAQRKLVDYQQKFKEITTNDQIKVDQ
jgi:hypothetical protein